MIAALGGSAYTIVTAPLLPWWAIAALAAVALTILAIGLWRRAGGLFWRFAAIAMLLAILVNPSLVAEKRSPLSPNVPSWPLAIMRALSFGAAPVPSETTTKGPSSSHRSRGRSAAERRVHAQSSFDELLARGSAGSHCIIS